MLAASSRTTTSARAQTNRLVQILRSLPFIMDILPRFSVVFTKKFPHGVKLSFAICFIVLISSAAALPPMERGPDGPAKRTSPGDNWAGSQGLKLLWQTAVYVCGNKRGGRPFVCPSSTLEDLRCLDMSQLCDGISDCAANEDEEVAACLLLGQERRVFGRMGQLPKEA